MKIKIVDIANQLELSLGTGDSYLNKTTGELYYITHDIFGYIDSSEQGDTFENLPDWERDLVMVAKGINETGNYLRLPSTYELNEYGMMEKFCLSINDERFRDELYSVIKGSGAFRRFKDCIYQHAVEKDWFEFKRNELVSVALDWCKANEIEFE